MAIGDSFGGRGPAILAAGWVLGGLGVILTAVRLWAASQKAGRLRWDFIWVTLAIIWAVGSHTCFTISILYGLANHTSKLSLPDLFEALKWVWMSLFVGIVAATFAKFAIISLFLQVASPNAKKRRIMLWTLGVTLGCVQITQIFLSLNKCKPIEKLWYPLRPGTCPLNDVSAKFSYFQGAVNAFHDIFLSLYPISIVYNLQTNLKTKIAFCGLMAGGVIPSIAVIIRTYSLAPLTHSSDPMWDFGPFMIWASTELWTVIIISSIPPLRPLFLRFFGKVGSKLTTSRDRTGGSRVKTGTALSNLNRSVLDKKGGMQTHTAQIIEMDDNSSQEEILGRDRLGAGNGGIMVSRQVDVETGHV